MDSPLAKSQRGLTFGEEAAWTHLSRRASVDSPLAKSQRELTFDEEAPGTHLWRRASTNSPYLKSQRGLTFGEEPAWTLRREIHPNHKGDNETDLQD